MKNLIFLIAFTLAGYHLQAQDIQWISFEKAVELNKKEPKPMLVSIYTDWCGWCKKMDRETYTNKVIKQYINDHFYAVKLNGEQKEDIVYKDYTFTFKKQGRRGYNEFAAALMDGKLSYPTTVFLNEKLELLDRVPGFLEPKIMEQVTTFFAAEKYKSQSWDEFVKDFKSNLK